MNRRSHARAYWTCQLVGWTAYAALGLVFIALFPPGPAFWRFALTYAAAAAIAVGATHLYRGWMRRRQWRRLPPQRLLPRVGAASALLGAGITALLALVYPLMFARPFLQAGGWSWLFPALCTWMGAAFFWNVIYFGLHYFEQYREAEIGALRLAVAAKDANLRALQTQLNPHFVFNALNSVRALVSEDPGRAQLMVTELACLLRYTLSAERRPTVPLAEELEAVGAYLKLEGIRLEERLRVEIAADPATLAQPVPILLLQTLVENGIKHGIAPLPQGGRLRITARLAGTRLEVEIVNSGRWPGARTAGDRQPGGVGLENARARLHLLYAGQARLEIGDQGAGEVMAAVSLPLAGGVGAAQ